MYRATILALMSLAGTAVSAPPSEDQQGDPLPAGAIARLGTVRWRHDAVVAFAAYAPDGKSVVCVSHDGTIRVWEFPAGKEIRRITASAKATRLNAAALSADGKTIATSFNPVDSTKSEQEIHVHEVGTGKEPASLKVESGIINELTFSPDGRTLTSRDAEGTVRIWDWAKGKEEAKFTSPVAGLTTGRTSGPRTIDDLIASRGMSVKKDQLVYAPDGKSLMFFGLSHVPRFVEVPTGKEIQAGTGPMEPVVAVWFTPDGKEIFTHARDGSVYRWDAVSRKDLGVVKLPTPAGGRLIVSPDGRFAVDWPTLASGPGGWGGGGPGPLPGGGAGRPVATEATLYDLTSGKEIGKIADKGRARLSMNSPRFSPDGKILAVTSVGDANIELYDVASAKPLRTLEVEKNNPGGGFGRSSASVPNLLFAPDSKTLAFQKSVDATDILLFDVATGKEIAALVLPEDPQADPDPPNPGGFPGGRAIRKATPLHGSFSPDGRCLAVAAGEQVILYELATGNTRRTYGTKSPPGTGGATATFLDAGPVMALSPDGTLLARAGGHDGTVHLWDIATAKEVASLKGHTGAVTAVAFAPNGKTIVSSAADTTALVWAIDKIDRPGKPTKRPDSADLEKWWQALAGDDAAKAAAAMNDLTAAPEQAMALVKEQVNPAAPLDKARAEKWLKELDDGEFEVRQKAASELGKIGERLLPMIDKALAVDPSAEARKHLEELRGKVTARIARGDRLRVLRAIEVLERIATPEALELLRAVADWAPGGPLTMQARGSLERMDRKDK